MTSVSDRGVARMVAVPCRFPGCLTFEGIPVASVVLVVRVSVRIGHIGSIRDVGDGTTGPRGTGTIGGTLAPLGQARTKEQSMNKRVVFIEAPGGSDKGDSGHRRDTMPMVEALRAKGWHAETLFYTDEKRDEIFDYIVKDFDAYVPRVNPGSMPSGETVFFDMLRALTDEGVIGMPHPDAMIGYGAKDALVRLTDTDLVPDVTFSY